MADEETTTTEEEKKGGGKKKLVMIIAPVVLVAAGAGYFLTAGGDADAESATTTTEVVEGDVIEVDTLTVNLVGEEGRFARLGFAVVLKEGADTSVVGAKLPLLRDAAITVMTGYGSTELQTAEGMTKLRQELSDEMASLFPDGEIIRAVLTELIVQ
jgi:flagellar FliL protein